MKYILLYVLFFLSTLSSIAQPTFQTKFGGTGGDQVKQMNVTSDGGCILTGITAGRLMLARLNSIGDTLWTHMMIDTNNYVSRGFSVKQLNDGGFVFLGQIYIGYNQTMYVIRTNSLGNVLWSKA